MGIDQTEQAKVWLSVRPNRSNFIRARLKYMGIGQTDRIQILVLDIANTPKYGYWPDQTDRNMGVDQTGRIKLWVLARPNRPKYEYSPIGPHRNIGNDQTGEIKIWVLARLTRPKYGY